jgi:hypothetical protein
VGDPERRSLSAAVLENAWAAVRDRRYSAIFSHVLFVGMYAPDGRYYHTILSIADKE